MEYTELGGHRTLLQLLGLTYHADDFGGCHLSQATRWLIIGGRAAMTLSPVADRLLAFGQYIDRE